MAKQLVSGDTLIAAAATIAGAILGGVSQDKGLGGARSAADEAVSIAADVVGKLHAKLLDG